MLKLYPIILDFVSDVAPLIGRIARRDPDLARQLRRSSTAVALNTAEGMYAQGRTRTHCYGIALREMRELLSGGLRAAPRGCAHAHPAPGGRTRGRGATRLSRAAACAARGAGSADPRYARPSLIPARRLAARIEGAARGHSRAARTTKSGAIRAAARKPAPPQSATYGFGSTRRTRVPMTWLKRPSVSDGTGASQPRASAVSRHASASLAEAAAD